MNKLNTLTVSVASLLLIACGGGGGGSSTPATPTPVAPPVTPPPSTTPETTTTTTTQETNTEYDKTADLVVDKSFALSQEYKLNVSYTNNTNRKAYLSVCSEFSQDNEKLDIDYSNCLVRTAADSSYDGVLNVANDTTKLVMAIWYLDDINNPRFEVWENDNSEGVKTFTVN